jgi:hypothetical protein
LYSTTSPPTGRRSIDNYFETYVPIAKRIPGLRFYVANSGEPELLAGN